MNDRPQPEDSVAIGCGCLIAALAFSGIAWYTIFRLAAWAWEAIT